MHKYQNSCFWAYFNGSRLITTIWLEMSENSYFRDFSAQVSHIVFFSLFDRFYGFSTTVWPEMSENSYLRHFSAQVSQIVFLAYLTALQSYYNYMRCNLRKLISLQSQCTSITTRFLSLFDSFTAYYNFMSGNLRKLVSSRFQCTSIIIRVLELILTVQGLLQLYDLNCQRTHISMISVHKYHTSFF